MLPFMALHLRARIAASPAGSERPLERQEMIDLARGVDLERLDLTGYDAYCDERYARNTVLLNEHVELVVICWLPGQASAIHDHGRSNCLYLVVHGSMREDLFELDATGRPRRTRTRTFGRGDITLAAPADVHRIANETDAGLVTVHIYSPPLDDRVTQFTPIPTRSRASS
jgi:predicted metal-dependent enzyme (double-stranded beta helix superfamily)